MASCTKHFQQRMSQRGISGDMIEMAQQFGVIKGDKLELNRRELELLLDRVRSAQRTVMKLLDKGGISIVEAEGALITTYRVDSFDRRLAKAGSRRARRPRAWQRMHHCG
jgi:hypothetical protein